MAIEPLLDYELSELVRFYGTLIGTPGTDAEVTKLCNKNLLNLLKAMQPSTDKVTAKKAGIITK